MHAGHVMGDRKPHMLVLDGCFHGRTLAAALITDTSRESYAQRKSQLIMRVQERSGWNYVLTTPVNDVEGLKHWFHRADTEGCHIHTMYIEGVMGEGNPGVAVTPEFYMAARNLTLEHDAALVVDSVQAGMRATGNLSICDYPGFETLPPPDFEVWSKAINGGQFPVSIVGLSPRGASWYQHGVYGNTMTGNPRACRVMAASLRKMTPDLRANIQDKGRYFVEAYTKLQDELPGVIVQVNGTGLLYQVKLDPKYPVTAKDVGVELELRRRGINVIHGGTNALRFTPNFDISQEEADMQIAHVREVLRERAGLA
jgi:acetylornithine/succinyldiaminopimelate/putrescine aminotransferase